MSFARRYRSRIRKLQFSIAFLSKHLIFSSEIIKSCTSQSDCFIKDDPRKGHNKGQIWARERTVTQWKSPIYSYNTLAVYIPIED